MHTKSGIFVIIFALLFLNNFSYSQSVNNRAFKFSHPLTSGNNNRINPNNFKSFYSVPDTLKIIAVMVQYQEDSDPRSTGNGKFDLSNKYYNPTLQRDTVVDSPPYDSVYFKDHLEFLKNYYYKSSKGKVILNYQLINNVITLPKKMQDYSPQKNETNLKLGEMFKDVWSGADNFINFSNLDSNKTAFVIFHAGVGRDIDLTSIFGYDPTPYDIPSIFLGIKTLKEIYGNNYNGYTTSSGFTIKNSLIIPSTEIRELSLISGYALLQLGINGILCASYGSFLGLPDLFDTQSGKTAIGRFGLMDGQAIFSYNGIFPPEPSAWEKIYLGWVNPIVISSGDSYFNVKTSSVDSPADSTIFKVLINSKEYFLIENRNRNADNLGQKMYSHNRAFYDSTVFTKDVPGFLNYDIYAIDGNVVNVKYLDWSLPGAISDTSNFRGGILIWHIDENIIDAKIGNNAVNTDLNHRGVDVEEAKGSQDIGVTYHTPFGDFTGDGSFVDFWYNGNHYVPSNIYINQFTPYTYPNTLSYSLSNNNIFITDFDTISPVMKIRIKIGSDAIKPLTGFPKYIGGTNSFNNLQPMAFDINGDGKDEFFVNNGLNLYGFRTDGNSISNSSTGLLIGNYGRTPVTYAFSSAMSNTQRLILQSQGGDKLGFFNIVNNVVIDSVIDNISVNSFGMTTFPLVFDSSKVVLGIANGWIIERKINGTQNLIDSSRNISPTALSKVDNNRYLVRSGNASSIITGNITGTNSLDSLELNFANKKFYLNGNILNINYKISNISSPILTDVNKDGKQEIIFQADGKLFVINSGGVLLEHFPVNFNSQVSPGIAVADVNGDGVFDIVFQTTNGDLYAYGINGKVVDGFPIKAGANPLSTPAIANLNDTLGIITLGSDGYLYAFKTNSVYKESNVLWKNFQKDKYLSNNNFKSINGGNQYSEKLPKDKVYNWPNPVYENNTYIRYYINGSSASVTIKILDLSGELVAKLNATSNPNSDNEIIWDVSKVQSGIYYGVVDAEIDGTKETKIIKIAVVK